MAVNRRRFLQAAGGALALPLLEASAAVTPSVPLRLLIVGNPFGMHPDYFFPKDYGAAFTPSETLQTLGWLNDRMTVLSHTDHGLRSGHGREVAFLSGVLPEISDAFPDKNMTVDQVVARHIGSQVRFPSIHTALDRGIRLSWNSSGVALSPCLDPHKLFGKLFVNLSPAERGVQRALLERNSSVLDTVHDQLKRLNAGSSGSDRHRLDQFTTSIRELESNLSTGMRWVDNDKPTFSIEQHFQEAEVTIENRYNSIFDMVSFAFETDLTRVATVGFSPETNYTELEGVNRGYHACTHNGKREKIIDELIAIESFQIAQLSRCLRKLDSIQEPGSDNSLLDSTVVLFGSGMGYGGTHSNRNLPIFVAGGGFKHRGHIDARKADGENMPLCNLFLTLLQRFGIEREQFNTSTGTFDLDYA